MQREQKLEKYIFNISGLSSKVYSAKNLQGRVGARIFKCYPIVMHISKDCVNFKPLIYHELGHLFTLGNNCFIIEEVLAQLWAFKTLIKNKKLYNQSYSWVKRWHTCKNSHTEGYTQAADIILQCLQKESINYLL